MLVQLVVGAPDKITEARRLLSEDLADLDRTCSRFRLDSEVVAIGRAPADDSGLVTATVSPLRRGGAASPAWAIPAGIWPLATTNDTSGTWVRRNSAMSG